MSEQADIEQLADEVSPWSAAIAARLRAVAWRVGRLERAADELVDDARQTALARHGAVLALTLLPTSRRRQ